MNYYDVTIPISMETPVWPGDKGVILSREASMAKGASYNESYLSLGTHTGTHIDAPFHALADGQTLDQISLEQFIGSAQVLKIPDDVSCITADILQTCDIKDGIHALLFKTSNSRWWKEDPCQFREDYVALDSSAAEYLTTKHIQLAGIDWFSISPMHDLEAPHIILLKAGILILENLDLSEVEVGLYTLFALPLKLVGTDGAPVRAILVSEA